MEHADQNASDEAWLLMNRRLLYLDGVRGIAAIGVVVWHYQHFFVLGPTCQESTSEGICNGNPAPLYSLLKYFYEHGYRMVDLFFVISGLVMYQRYGSDVRLHRVAFVAYIMRRIGRLYPLAVLTLCIAAILTWIHRVFHGEFLFYSENDPVAFALNLVFAHAGFFQNIGLSFNGPSWTIALEFWVYIIFFVVASRAKNLPMAVAGIALLSTVLLVNHEQQLMSQWYRAISGFFWGATISVVQEKIVTMSRYRRIIARATGWIAVIGFLVFALSLYDTTATNTLGFADDQRAHLWHLIVVFIPLVLMLSLLEAPRNQKLASGLGWMGSISYGVYMWHVPVQMALVLVLRSTAVSSPQYSHWLLAIYVLLVIVVARIGYVRFEKPLQACISAVATTLTQLPNKGDSPPPTT